MIVKILASSASFAGVRYNHEKMRTGKGELLKVKNFGALMLLTKHRPQDYIHYLKSVSAVNKRISRPQFHAVISAKGKSSSKDELREVAEKWLSAMGYGENPYLIIFHNDTENNHVHIVSTRVDKDGKKISAAFERIRAVRALSAICSPPLLNAEMINTLLTYRLSTIAQVRTLLEKTGFEVQPEKDVLRIMSSGKVLQELKLKDIENKCRAYSTDPKRVRQLKAIFQKIWDGDSRFSSESFDAKDISSKLELFSRDIRKRSGIELVFHAKDGKQPYGYTIIDYSTKSVFKGSEVMPVSHIIGNCAISDQPGDLTARYQVSFADPGISVNSILTGQEGADFYEEPVHRINLTDDIDDEAIHGRNRQRKGKARTNTR